MEWGGALSGLFSAAIERLPKNYFLRGVGILSGGTAGAQILMILAAPLLTRLYTPEDFGVLAVYAGLLSVISVIACLRYEIAIPLPKTDVASFNIMFLCLLTLTAVTLILALPILFFRTELVSALGLEAVAEFTWLIPVGVYAIGLYSILNYWAIRKKSFKDIALTRLSQALTTLSIQIGLFKFGAVSLVSGQAAGQGAGAFRLLQKLDKKRFRQSIRAKRVRLLAYRYRNFPLFSTWTGFFNALGNQLPPIMFAAFFSSGIAGLYALAHRVTSVPASVIGQSVANVFLSSAPEARRGGTLDGLLFNVVHALALLAFPAGMFLVINAEFLFAIVFGENWRDAGVYAAILVPMLAIGFITAPVTTLCAVLDKQVAGAVFQFFMMAVRVGSIVFGVHVSDSLIALKLFSGLSAVCYFCFLLWLTMASAGRPVRMVVMLMRTLAISATIPLVIFVTTLFDEDILKAGMPVVIVSLVAMLCVYFINHKTWRYFGKA